MAETLEGFDPTDFRTAIRAAMVMGAPPVEADRAVFSFPQEVLNASPADVEEVPFDPSARPDSLPPVTDTVPCAVEYFDAAGRPVDFGVINPSKIKLTLLDEDYAKIRDFSYVTIGGDIYDYAKTEPPIGLGVVGVFTVHCIARDET